METGPFRDISLPPGPVLESLAKAGIFLQTACGGAGKCAKCKVVTLEGDFDPPDDAEIKHLSRCEPGEGTRLACRLKATGPCRLRVPQTSIVDSQTVTTQNLRKAPNNQNYGLAVDLGTTRLSALLISLADGRAAAASKSLNPQMYYGLDVLSRLQAALQGNAENLQKSVVHRMNTMIADICAKRDIAPDRIKIVCIVGNTAMTHLLLKMDVAGLAHAPYEPVTLAPQSLPAEDIGIAAGPSAPLLIPHSVGGFVGSDHTAFIAAVRTHHFPEPLLALDIGTNSEIFLTDAATGCHLSVSSPSGPAFEAGQISCGRLAGDGVASAIKWTGKGFDLTFKGAQLPSGLCGSALIQVLAESYQAGIINKRGRIQSTGSLVTSTADGLAIVLWRAKEGLCAPPLLLTQADIDALLLAKGAIRTGIDILLRKSGLSSRDIKKVILGGAFGTGLDLRAASVIGLFPSTFPKLFEPINEAAATGAADILFDFYKNGRLKDFRGPIEHINLAVLPEFKKSFARSIYFP